MKIKNLLIALLMLSSMLFAQDTVQTFLSLERSGVSKFIKDNPEFDGRGTIIIILDTGVDMGIDGLLKTTTGETKVIDVQDFTKQGDIKFYEADVEKEDGYVEYLNEDQNLSVKVKSDLPLKADDDAYYIGAIKESLWMNSGSGISDVNGNGKEDDTFCFLTFKVANEDYWVVFLDLNGNGELSDEKPIRNYKDELQSFVFKNEKGLTPFAMGLNIFPDEEIVSFHFDDGSHGTHCAGIAAGNMIDGNSFNGVAPGAYVMSMKIGNNNFSGGSTVAESMKKAFLYADKVSKERSEPCIINMSFGIGSEIEGHAEIEKFIDDLVKENPYLYVCTSNGNEGTGISSSGIPAALKSIFSSGAILTQDVGRDLYGANLKDDIILYFSSRGGEVSKPDVISPGACASTVPNFVGWDRFWGTSMASPYSAGVMSLLLSAAKVEFPDVKIPSRLLYRIVKESAVKMDAYQDIDQGGGYINVITAYELLKKYIKNNEINNFETYTTKALAPNMPNNTASNIYLRDARFLQNDNSFRVSVSRDNFLNSNKFYRNYILESDKDWLDLTTKKTYLRNDQSTFVDLKLNLDKMTEPGLYNGVVKAYRTGEEKAAEFDFMVTAVIPFEFNTKNNYEQTFKGELDPGMFKRYFVAVPPAASAMHIKLNSLKDKYGKAEFRVFDQDGRSVYTSPPIDTKENKFERENSFYDLTPGIYEVVVTGSFSALDLSFYELAISFKGINRLNDYKISGDHNSIKVINEFTGSTRYNLSGEINGYKKTHFITIDEKTVYHFPFTLYKNEESKEFNISVSKEDYNKLTDFAFQILDENGKAVRISALSYNNDNISLTNRYEADSTKFVLELVPAFANLPNSLNVHIEENGNFKNSENIDVRVGKSKSVTLYPSIIETLELNYVKPADKIPAGANYCGEIYFKNSVNDKLEQELPLIFK